MNNPFLEWNISDFFDIFWKTFIYFENHNSFFKTLYEVISHVFHWIIWYPSTRSSKSLLFINFSSCELEKRFWVHSDRVIVCLLIQKIVTKYEFYYILFLYFSKNILLFLKYTWLFLYFNHLKIYKIFSLKIKYFSLCKRKK